MLQLATEKIQDLCNCNQSVGFSSISVFFPVQWTGPANTIVVGVEHESIWGTSQIGEQVGIGTK